MTGEHDIVSEVVESGEEIAPPTWAELEQCVPPDILPKLRARVRDMRRLARMHVLVARQRDIVQALDHGSLTSAEWWQLQDEFTAASREMNKLVEAAR